MLDNLKEWRVSEISDSLKHIIEDHFSYVKIRGEVSGLKKYLSGHIYFNLKDERSLLNAVCFKNIANNLKILPKEGEEIVAIGKITSYAARSNYQIMVMKIELLGEGNLMALFEKKKKQFLAEGLFDQKHKQEIPKFSKKVAVITSKAGAVFFDICHRIKDRFPLCAIVFYPCSVQGKGVEIKIANAINFFNEERDDVDVLIIARGGGSVEDLWAFNEEIIIRSVFNSKIPIISAIGHETDTTLIDFVSDLRAPTPTAAAEFVTPNKETLLDKIRESMNFIARKYFSNEAFLKQKIDFLFASLKTPKNLIDEREAKIKELSYKLMSEKNRYFDKINNSFDIKKQMLESLSYKQTLARGYVVVRDDQDKIISKAKNITNNLQLEFFDGIIKATKN